MKPPRAKTTTIPLPTQPIFFEKGKAMADTENQDTKVSRREAFGLSSAALTAAAALSLAGARNAHASPQAQKPAPHKAPNEVDPGPQNVPLAAENPDSE